MTTLLGAASNSIFINFRKGKPDSPPTRLPLLQPFRPPSPNSLSHYEAPDYDDLSEFDEEEDEEEELPVISSSGGPAAPRGSSSGDYNVVAGDIDQQNTDATLFYDCEDNDGSGDQEDDVFTEAQAMHPQTFEGKREGQEKWHQKEVRYIKLLQGCCCSYIVNALLELY